MLAALRDYAAHPDAATRAANTVALVVGFNGPFYPAYVWMLAPQAGPAAMWTMLASPFFLAIPWLSRRHASAARAALPLIGLANTVWTVALLGTGAAVEAFIFPCLVLAMLCWRERTVMLVLLGVGLLAQQAALRWPWPPISATSPDSQVALVVLNSTSVGALVVFVLVTCAGLLRPPVS